LFRNEAAVISGNQRTIVNKGTRVLLPMMV